MKGFWRKVLLAMGFAPLLFFFNEYYLKPKYSSQNEIVKEKEKQVIIQVEDASAPKAELKVLSGKAATKSTEALLLERIQNFSENVKSILPALKEEWQEEGKSLLKNLEECQGRDYCGMKPDEDGYFDESETHARKSQVRLLDLLNQAFEESKDKKFLLETSVLDDFLLSGNQKLITGALTQLKEKGELKDSLQKLSGKGAAEAILLLSKNVSSEELILLIEQALDGTSGLTAVSVFEILEKIQFNEQEFEAILKRVCHLKSGLPHNWKPIEAISKRIAKERGFGTDASTVCP